MQKGVSILLCTFFLFQQDLTFNTGLDKVPGKSCLILTKCQSMFLQNKEIYNEICSSLYLKIFINMFKYLN